MEPEDLLSLAREGASLERQREALAEVLRAELDADIADEIMDHAHDAVALLEEGDGRSRIGGPALLPAGEAWPQDPEGAPLGFIAALDLGELPPLAPLPPDGTLLVFWDHQVHDLPSMDFVAATRVFYVPEGETAEEADAPDPDEVFDAIPLTGLVMPVLSSEAREIHLDDDEEQERLWDAVDAVDPASHQLLGVSRDVQNPVLDEIASWFEHGYAATRERYDAAELRGEGWRLLAQFGSTGELMFGDVGALYLVILERDLADRRFDRVMGIMQSH